MSIATSFYSADAHIHDAITHLLGSYQKTLGNIKKTLALGLTLRIGIVDIRDNQDIQATEAFLKQLGVDPNSINIDRVRGVGRGLNLSKEDAVTALCGKCASGQCAITAEGIVYPCIMARTFPLGSVLEKTIDDILNGETFKSTSDVLNAAFAARVSPSNLLCGPPPQPPPCPPSGPRPPCAPLAPCPPMGGSPCIPRCIPGCGPPCPPRR